VPSVRITPIDPPYPAEVQSAFDRIMRGAPPLLLFRTVARNPRVLERFLAGSLLDRGSISLRLRELMILRTCALCEAEYEWGVHVAAFGEKASWTAEQVHATVHGSRTDACWSAQEACVIRLADELPRHERGHRRGVARGVRSVHAGATHRTRHAGRSLSRRIVHGQRIRGAP